MAEAQSTSIDYMTAPFHMTRVLDWGTRPDWSPDGSRIAFTESDVRDTHAYEIVLETGEVRCLTCWLGMNGLVTRIYYLPDSSHLILAPRDLASKAISSKASNRSDSLDQALYWAPASFDSAPIALEARAFGEIAISRRLSAGGEMQIAWGEITEKGSALRTARLVHDGNRARLEGTVTLYDPSRQAPASGVTFIETYGFVQDDKAILFFTVDFNGGKPDGGMYLFDIASASVRWLYKDPAHNETHLFPDERYGLEESNRASDPDGAWAGISALDESAVQAFLQRAGQKAPAEAELANYAPGKYLRGLNRPFDLYVLDLQAPAEPRQLTDFSRYGANAHQSVPGPGGRRIAFAVDERCRPGFAGRGGLYIGNFGS